jgi:hypothetical protein
MTPCGWSWLTAAFRASPWRGFPRLLHATREQRLDFELSMCGIHWEAIDEDISTAGLLAGRGDMTRPGKAAA